MGEGGFIKQLTGFNSKPQPQQQPQQQQKTDTGADKIEP